MVQNHAPAAMAGFRGRQAATSSYDRGPPGRVAQWESARFTRERSLVRNQPRPYPDSWLYALVSERDR